MLRYCALRALSGVDVNLSAFVRSLLTPTVRTLPRSHRTSGSGRTIVTTIRIDGNHLYIRTRTQRSLVGRPSSTPRPAPQDDQLVSKYRILRLRPALRLE